MTDHMREIEEYAAAASSHDNEVVCIETKYGSLTPKKKPLISKDHGRSFFDSADWALSKQGVAVNQQQSIETLRPKLQRTPHQQLPPRRPACTSPSGNYFGGN